jgi:hypothetical protein
MKQTVLHLMNHENTFHLMNRTKLRYLLTRYKILTADTKIMFDKYFSSSNSLQASILLPRAQG